MHGFHLLYLVIILTFGALLARLGYLVEPDDPTIPLIAGILGLLLGYFLLTVPILLKSQQIEPCEQCGNHLIEYDPQRNQIHMVCECGRSWEIDGSCLYEILDDRRCLVAKRNWLGNWKKI